MLGRERLTVRAESDQAVVAQADSIGVFAVNPYSLCAITKCASDVGFATGPDTAVSATTHGVMTHSIHTGYWGSHFVGARRLG